MNQRYAPFVPRLMRLLPVCIAVFLIAWSGCSQNDAQRQFEDRAFRDPENITETDISGNIENKDEDDWQVAPMYSGIIRVQKPAFPNPVQSGQQIEIQLSITGIESVTSIEVMTRNENNNWQRLEYESDPETGLLVFQIDPRLFTYTDNYQNAIGLHRVFFFDSNDNLITYGDVKIE